MRTGGQPNCEFVAQQRASVLGYEHLASTSTTTLLSLYSNAERRDGSMRRGDNAYGQEFFPSVAASPRMRCDSVFMAGLQGTRLSNT
jgi:hypothetical protein